MVKDAFIEDTKSSTIAPENSNNTISISIGELGSTGSQRYKLTSTNETAKQKDAISEATKSSIIALRNSSSIHRAGNTSDKPRNPINQIAVKKDITGFIEDAESGDSIGETATLSIEPASSNTSQNSTDEIGDTSIKNYAGVRREDPIDKTRPSVNLNATTPTSRHKQWKVNTPNQTSEKPAIKVTNKETGNDRQNGGKEKTGEITLDNYQSGTQTSSTGYATAVKKDEPTSRTQLVYRHNKITDSFIKDEVTDAVEHNRTRLFKNNTLKQHTGDINKQYDERSECE